MRLRALVPVLAAAGFVLAFAVPAPAQIYALHFRQEKDAKSYKKFLHDVGGEKVLLVMIKSGVQRTAGNLAWDPKERLEFFVADPADPAKVPYRVRDGELEVAQKKLVVGVAGDRVDHLRSFMPDESFLTLAREYERRLAALEELEARRKDEKKGSKAWFALIKTRVQALEQLQVWLRQTGYEKAANKLERDLARARKDLESGAAARQEAALASIHPVDPPEELVAAAAEVASGVTFHGMESQHVRIWYHDGIEEARIARVLELGERGIELFQVRFADPYVDESFPNTIPEGQFVEFFFCDDDPYHYEKLMEAYYGFGWGSGEQKERRLQAAGSRRSLEDATLAYWKIGEDEDLEGIVLHELGHDLARLHYGIRRDQDWLEEGAGYYLSFELLNRNNVNCFAFEPPRRSEGTVARGPNGEKAKEDDQTVAVMKGLREVMAEMAIHAGTPFDQLAKKELWQFGNEDMAKSWSFYDWLANQAGRDGQVWLRQVCKLANGDRSAFSAELRSSAAATFGLTGSGDPIRQLEERWTEWVVAHYGVEPPRR